MITTIAQNWWVLALRGVAAILFALGMFLWPGLTLAVLVLLFGAYALADGVFAIITGITTRHAQERWWMMVLVGVAGMLAGMLTLFWPGLTALALLYGIAAWSMVTGIFEIAAAIRLRKEIEGEWQLGLAGFASLLFGLILVSRPGIGALTLSWLLGAYALLYGILLLVLALQMRSLRNRITRQSVAAV